MAAHSLLAILLAFALPAQEPALAVSSPAGTADDPAPRRIPGQAPEETESRPVQMNSGAVEAPPPQAFPVDNIPITDRWRLAETLKLVKPRWFDPYNQNTYKGDRPIFGTNDWFLSLTAISDTLVEPRSFPVPVAGNTSSHPGTNNTFSRVDSVVAAQTVIAGASLIKGQTAFKPQELEMRLTLAYNYNSARISERQILNIASSKEPHRTDDFLGVQEAFVEYHIRNVSDRYDFDAVRAGIQPFTTDFRGFLFQDNQLGLRFFGNRDNNRYQYNLAVFQRLEKDTNSGLNDVGAPTRDDTVFVANLYRQDLPLPGITSQVTVVYDRDREKDKTHFDKNGFPVRPALIGNDRTRDYDVVYLGYNADGHIGRVNITASAYGAMGEDRNNIFTGKPADIRSYFLAVEPSMDFSWARIRLSGLYASGDSKPYDNTETGFDAIQENPQFAGADTSYWIRQSIPFIGGGLVSINGRNGVLNSLRSSKDEGQSNFNNPGTVLLGMGGDFDLTPTLRVTTNVNYLWFANTTVVETLRQQGSIPTDLGLDYSAAVTWRPMMTQNVVFRAAAAMFEPGDGFRNLYVAQGVDSRFYSLLFNAILSF